MTAKWSRKRPRAQPILGQGCIASSVCANPRAHSTGHGVPVHLHWPSPGHLYVCSTFILGSRQVE